jgi:hypothetical protein
MTRLDSSVTTFKLSNARGTVRLYLSAFLLVMMFGYLHSIFFVYTTTALSPRGTELRYRGTPQADIEKAAADGKEIQYEKPLGEMLNITHTHILSMAFMFFCTGGIFLFSSLNEKLKVFLIIEPFAAIATSFTSMWLMRYVHPAFSWLLVASSGSAAIIFFVVACLSLYEMWKPETK